MIANQNLNSTMQLLIIAFLVLLNSSVTYQHVRIQIPILASIRNHRNLNLINQKGCGPISTDRVIGGVNARLREFPWIALLGYQSTEKWKCGGTLISKRFVLTAAHCINKELNIVRLGEHTISKQRDCIDIDQCADPVQDIKIDSKIKHPDFNRKTKQNDLGLLKLAHNADLTKDNVRTICLPITPQNDIEEFNKPEAFLFLTGWGLTERGTAPDILQKALIPYIDSKACNAIFNPLNIQIYNGQLCAGYGKDSLHKKTESCRESCTLPGSHQESTCEKIHRCDYFQNILRRYGGRPPQNVVDDIRLHQCPGSSNVCCPDNAGPPPPPQDLKIQNPILTSIRNHRNIHLINQKSCGVVATNRVIGGFNADIKEFPWVALLGYRSAKQTDWQCGGTLISQRFVLTAAHCVEKDLYLVRLGEHTISKQTDCDDTDQCADPVQDIMIDSKLKHPQFDRRAKQNDLALLKLMKPADITKNNVKTICLPITPQNNVEEYDKPNMLLILTGWGKTDGGTKSDILQKAYVPYIDSEACNAIFNPEGFDIHPGQLCAGYAKGSANKKTDSCKGM
ncbi:serine protease 7-like [Chironomus tepperi]|uniref:serine protease 7-like n=1 Tax=Chironomus tepperi TaxID=113505 RepID=UPI00391F6468